MIALAALQALPFPWLVLAADGTLVEHSEDSLFEDPVSNVPDLVKKAATVSSPSWGVCNQGYAFYRFTSDALHPYSLVLYGLKVDGISTAQGRSSGLSIRLAAGQLVDFVAKFCAGLEGLDESYRALIRENIHEIRGINSALYNSAYELQQLLEGGGDARTESIARSVTSFSQILSGRIDFMEFLANPSSATSVSKQEIQVYKKFDKLQRCFRVTAGNRKIPLSLQGSSSSTVYGPPVFDLVPYLLLDNAVKYSPERYSIVVNINESSQYIFCSVSSVGPKIEEDERDKLFNPNFRGKNAVRSQTSGSGLGLAVLKRIVESVFNGNIEVIQDNAPCIWLSYVPYCHTKFEIKLPIAASQRRFR